MSHPQPWLFQSLGTARRVGTVLLDLHSPELVGEPTASPGSGPAKVDGCCLGTGLWRLIRAPGSGGGAEGGAGWPCFAGCQDYQRHLVTCWIMSVGSVTGVQSLDGRVVSPPQMTGSPFMGSSIPTSEAPRESSACWSSFPPRGLLLLTLLEAQTPAPHQAGADLRSSFTLVLVATGHLECRLQALLAALLPCGCGGARRPFQAAPHRGHDAKTRWPLLVNNLGLGFTGRGQWPAVRGLPPCHVHTLGGLQEQGQRRRPCSYRPIRREGKVLL